jgi:hypothetical protein
MFSHIVEIKIPRARTKKLMERIKRKRWEKLLMASEIVS